jgi:hypothetical protein
MYLSKLKRSSPCDPVGLVKGVLLVGVATAHRTPVVECLAWSEAFLGEVWTLRLGDGVAWWTRKGATLDIVVSRERMVFFSFGRREGRVVLGQKTHSWPSWMWV